MAVIQIDEIVLPTDISRGAQFGPTFSTVVVETVSGAETRISQWLVARHRGTIALEQRTPAQMAALKAFFLVRTGRARGFRFKDWTDYQVTNEPLIPQPPVNPPVGGPTLQLIKTYTDGLLNYVRNIYKPTVSPAITVRKNAVSFGGYSLDPTSGILTLTVLNSKSITAITQANPVVVTVGASHGFVSGDLIYFSGVTGMVTINGQVGQVTATGASTITIGALSTVSYPAYVSGGTAAKYLAATDTMDYSGTFEIPVRFDTDEAAVVAEDIAILSFSSIPICELIS
jgi:uncharacterized protein (TIGR02217 family)